MSKFRDDQKVRAPEIKPGQQGRARRDTASLNGTQIPQSTVVTVTALPAEPHLFIGGHGKQMGMTLRVDDFLFVPTYDAPAPLDPSKVKVGDTVTVEREGVTVRGKAGTHGLGILTAVFISGVGTLYFRDGWTLTDHQPAPGPEPEWKPGTAGTATVQGKAGVRVMRLDPDDRTAQILPWVSDHMIGGWYVHEDADVTDFVPDESVDPVVIAEVDGTIFRLSEVPAYADRLNEALREASQREKRVAIVREGKVLIDPAEVDLVHLQEVANSADAGEEAIAILGSLGIELP